MPVPRTVNQHLGKTPFFPKVRLGRKTPALGGFKHGHSPLVRGLRPKLLHKATHSQADLFPVRAEDTCSCGFETPSVNNSDRYFIHSKIDQPLESTIYEAA